MFGLFSTDVIDSTSSPAAWICRHRPSFWMRSMRALVAASFDCGQPRDDDVLAAVEGAGVLRFLVLRQRRGRSACTSSACFCTSPVSHSALFSSVCTLSVEIVRDVLVGERVGGARRELRIRRVERHVDQLAAAHLRDVAARPSSASGYAVRFDRRRSCVVGAGASACVDVIRRYGQAA